MREWVPVPGSTKARLIESAIHYFEQDGYKGVAVTDLAGKAGVTTGALYHHFGSKLRLYTVIRDDLEKRITDRMEGAAEAVATNPRAAVRAALLVGFDAANRFAVCRIVGEPMPTDQPDPIQRTLRTILPKQLGTAAVVLTAAWRAALLSVADGAPARSARMALEFTLTDEK